MTATFSTPTPESVKRLADAAEEGTHAGREYRNLIDDHMWDRDTWTLLIQDVQVNPYECGECPFEVSEAERLALHKRWSEHFTLGDHAQQAENRRGRA